MDRISNLSDDLLLKILSSLTSKDVVATMLLSKRWKFLWTLVPKLHFDDRFKEYFGDDCVPYRMFQQYVDMFLVSNKSPVLETLKFSLGCSYSTTDDLTTWIRIGIARRVRELEIIRSLDAYDYGEFNLPQCLYTFEKLVVLKLYGWIVLDVPTTVCLPSLKSLHLLCVEYKDEESHRRLLSSCPVLEELVLDHCENISPPCLYVVVPSLQRFSFIGGTYDGHDDTNVKVVLNAPYLKYLNIVDNFAIGLSCLTEDMPEIVEANVNVVYKSTEKLLRSLASVKRLSLCLSASVVQPCIEFHQLVHLELCPYVNKWWDLLTWILESSPKLQVLKLYKCKEHRFYGVEPIHGRWGQPSSVPECFSLQLNTFEWNYYNGRREEKRMLAYILRNAKRLKRAKIFAWGLGSYEGPRKLKKLASLHRASKSCRLLLECLKKL
ncbi:unnamed protein product [Microthlaspi erraticum]|uniref:F-box domain-containing protein n=1 Tax=Microthlaspi erraticum TaxID=1685480 RepID=A0A6D2LPX3_9BRAS|nr:unnamed protein product [Microthlaspi erraticum]